MTPCLPQTMRAFTSDGPNLFNASVKDVVLPIAGPNEAIVKVHYCAQNPTDWKYHANAHRGVIFGFDFSGVVVSLPPDARNDGLHLGDRVAGVVHGGLYTDEGSFAEYLKVETDLLFVLPSGMAMDEAATFGVAYVTAVQAIVQRQNNTWPPCNRGQGEWFLVYGASSSVGLFAVQIAKLVGYRVIGVCSPHNFDLVRSLGADEVVSYRDREVVERIHSITGSSIRSGLDTIAEGDSFRISVGAFGPEGGKLSVILGVPEAARRIRPDVNLEFLSMYTLFGKEFDFTPSKDEPPTTFPAVEVDRSLHVEIGKRTPGWITECGLKGNPVQLMGGLDDILDGFKYMAEGKVSGKKLVYKVVADA